MRSFSSRHATRRTTIKRPATYILANAPAGTLYIGVTSDLHMRMAQHEQGLIEGFTKRYGIRMLVYYEHHDTMDAAITREKQLKEWQRDWKLRLIMTMNPGWLNLYDETSGEIHDGPLDHR
ncbi:MAG: GIY-YIG nuclease family protein [Hyphomicrobiaceae bacterium]